MDADDAKELGRLGYAQELLRRMGGFSSFAVSFSIISVLTGCITGYSDALAAGGPAGIGLGWPIVSAGTMLVAIAMAELASAFPTAGALYHWSALLGGPGWGWLTAATNIVGQIAIVAAIDYGCASELAATIGSTSKVTPFILLAVILASHLVVNAFSVRLVALLNDFSATVHIVGVVVLVVALFALGKAQPVSFLAHHYTTGLEMHATVGFFNALVMSMFTFTGYDASAHLAEETHDPARRTPWGILTSVGVSAIAGFFLLAAITLAITDLPKTAADSHAALAVMQGALGSGAGRGAMGLAIAAMWFCGLSSVTSASRTLYAFSRDRGLPGSSYIGTVNPRTRTPLVAICVATTGPFVLVVATLPFDPFLFDAMAKMATMGLYVSYALPIFLGVLARHRGAWKRLGPFNVRGAGIPIAWLAVLWCAFVLVVCSLPPNPFPAELLGGLVAVFVAMWFSFVRNDFEGPRVKLAALEEAK